VLVNAAGPWVSRFLTERLGEASDTRVKLVQGSHIVVPRLYDGDFAYVLQNDDRRVVFVYAYESDYTLIGTTDVALEGEPRNCSASAAEIDYLCRAANRYFTRQIGPADVKWSYCGVRALVDDRAAEPSKITRDYVLDLDGGPGRAPVLSVYGGKITTYRRLAERVLVRLAPWFPGMRAPWTADALLPGGEVPGCDPISYARKIGRRYPDLPQTLIRAIVHRHGSRTPDMLGTARTIQDLGMHFGADLYAREVDYFRAREWALDVEDVLWRRTKAGLHLDDGQRTRLARYMATPREII
jgi:glycerol-3-phosphate dehydrogenase